MAIYKKRYGWGYKEYNSKTGLFKGETSYSTSMGEQDWMGKVIKPVPNKKRGMGANGYDD